MPPKWRCGARNPTDDLITRLAEAEIDGDRLTEREVVLTTATFVMAGVESLSSFMAMLALNLHDFPEARRRVVADPSLVGPAIEESLRFNTSAQRFKRVVMREAQLHGQTLRVGDKVALAFGSANRDGRKFPNPDVYDLDRRPIGHLGFGAGKHFCLGAPMARLVTETAMTRFLARVPDYYLTDRGACVEFILELPQPGRAAVRALSADWSLRNTFEFARTQLPRQLIEHGVDHAGLVLLEERAGDIDIFRYNDTRRHVGAMAKLVGAGPQHRP